MKINEAFETLKELHNEGVFTNFAPATARNKGVSGIIAEEVLGLPASTKTLDFEDGELKTVLVQIKSTGEITPKESVAITMINPEDVMSTPFAESKLKAKISKVIFMPHYKDNGYKTSLPPVLFSLAEHPEIMAKIEEDYENIRATLIANSGDITTLTGKNGCLVQARTKGSKGSTTRAFYFRSSFVSFVHDMVGWGRLTKASGEGTKDFWNSLGY